MVIDLNCHWWFEHNCHKVSFAFKVHSVTKLHDLFKKILRVWVQIVLQRQLNKLKASVSEAVYVSILAWKIITGYPVGRSYATASIALNIIEALYLRSNNIDPFLSEPASSSYLTETFGDKSFEMPVLENITGRIH